MYANYQSSGNNCTYGMEFLIHANVCLDSKIAFVFHLVGKLLVLMYTLRKYFGGHLGF